LKNLVITDLSGENKSNLAISLLLGFNCSEQIMNDPYYRVHLNGYVKTLRSF